jgi:hypothetical protein
MRSLILTLSIGAASLLGLLTISPSQAEAHLYRPWWWTCPYYSTYSYSAYKCFYWRGYPTSSYYWGYYGNSPSSTTSYSLPSKEPRAGDSAERPEHGTEGRSTDGLGSR